MEPITSLNDPLEPFDEEEGEEQKPDRARVTWLSAIILLAVAVLLVQLYRLQIAEGPSYREQADNNRFRIMTIAPPRGVIYDRHHDVLARNRPSYSVGVVPADLPAGADRQAVLERLAELVGIPASDVVKAVQADPSNQFSFIPVKDSVPQAVAFQLEERHRELPGVHVEPQPIREYTLGAITTPFLGYVGRISDAQYQRLKDDPVHRYSPVDTIGQIGIERAFETTLRGTPGQEQMEVDATGREVRSLGITQPVPGHNLVLTIDAGLQKEIADALGQGLSRYQVAAAVAIDPRDGQVLALVSLPSYDDNLFASGISQADYQKLIQDPRHPLLNQAIAATYPPGATFQIVTAAAGLDSGVITSKTRIDCAGFISVPNRYDPTVMTRLLDRKAFGQQDVESAIANSCDVFFYEVGGGDPSGRSDGLGIDALSRYARMFGLGDPTGIDLVGESSGLVPSVRWKRQNLGQEWVSMDTYETSVGEGYLTVTPLQMANVAAAIANGGTLYRPQLVLQTVDGQGNVLSGYQPDVIRKLPLKPEDLALVRQGMIDALGTGKTSQTSSYDGIARLAAVPNFPVGGVVGSPPFGSPDPKGNLATHGWFVGFAPAEHPTIALAIFLGNGSGPEDAARVAQRIFTYYHQQDN
ncbi:MAG: penicillin-binding protein 2 [Chloroflexota bacterium]